jgi:hypothetical protein
MNCDPEVEQWLRDKLPDRLLESPGADPLNMVFLAMQQAGAQSPPEQVMVAWHGMLATARMVRRQSEMAFIGAARAAEWSSEHVAAVLGLADATLLEQHERDLRREGLEQHPSQRPEQWTGS